MKTFSASLMGVLSLLASLPVMASVSSDRLLGTWRGSCSDGAAENLQLTPPYIRVISTLTFDSKQAVWEMRYFTSETCKTPAFAKTYTGNYSVQATQITGAFDKVGLTVLALDVAAALNQPTPYCAGSVWKVGESQEITRCSSSDSMLGKFTYAFDDSVEGVLLIGTSLKLKRTPNEF